jgi:DNA-binding LacI/PurR family transcriptional regulator
MIKKRQRLKVISGPRLHSMATAVPTQKSLARLTGFAQPTVSLALSGKGSVGAETRQKILDKALELGYHPDLNIDARRLGSRNSERPVPFGVVGLVWADTLGDLSAEGSFYNVLFAGIMKGCRETGQALMVMHVGLDQAQDMRFVSHSDGMIIPAASPKHADAARRIGKPWVTILAEFTSKAAPDVTDIGVDNHEAIEIAFRHLFERGHRRIGMIGPTMKSTNASQRWTAYCECLQQAGLPYRAADVLMESQYAFDQQGAVALRQIWRESDHPSAFIVYNDLMALGVLEAAHELGIRVPEEISLISIDDIPEASSSRIPLTTVSIDIAGMGHKAVLLLEEYARTGVYRPERIRMKLELKERASVKALAHQ